MGDTLRVGERVSAGQRMRSRDGTAIATMDTRGRFDIWDNNQRIYGWQPDTAGYNSFGLEADGAIGLWNGLEYTVLIRYVIPPDRIVLQNEGYLSAFDTTGREWPL